MISLQQGSDSDELFLEDTYVLKLLVVGGAGVGKTSLVRRYVDKIWNPRTLKTIGVDFSLKNVDVPVGDSKVHVRLQIWDFCGERRYRQLLPIYSQGTHGIFLCFDLSRPETLTQLQDWKLVLLRTLKRPAVFMVLGLKSDLNPEITLESLQDQTSRILRIKESLHCSAKTGENVEEAFNRIALLMFDKFFKNKENEDQ